MDQQRQRALTHFSPSNSVVSSQSDIHHSTDCHAGLVSLHRTRRLPMRKLILISALLLASVFRPGRRTSALDLPHARRSPSPTTQPQPLPPAAKDDKTDRAKPQGEQAAAQPRSPKPRSQARRYDERRSQGAPHRRQIRHLLVIPVSRSRRQSGRRDLSSRKSFDHGQCEIRPHDRLHRSASVRKSSATPTGISIRRRRSKLSVQ